MAVSQSYREFVLEQLGRVTPVNGKSAAEIFGYPDDLKLRSSMSLFASVSPADSAFCRVLAQYFGGEPDQRTLELLQKQAST